MPIASHKKATKDSSSTHSSQARSPDHLTHHSTTTSVRGSSSTPSLTTHSQSRGDHNAQHGHGSANSDSTHNHSHPNEDRHCTLNTASAERTISNSSSGSGCSLGSLHHSSRSGASFHHGHSPHHQHGPPSWGDKEKVTLLVDGKRFSMNPNLLVKHSNTMLGRYGRKIHV